MKVICQIELFLPASVSCRAYESETWFAQTGAAAEGVMAQSPPTLQAAAGSRGIDCRKFFRRQRADKTDLFCAGAVVAAGDAHTPSGSTKAWA